MSPPQGSFPRFSRLDQAPDNSLCKQAEPLLHSTYHYSNYTHTSVFPSRLWAPGGRNGFCFAHHCQVQSRSSHTGAERAEEVTKLGLPPLKRGPCHQARRWWSWDLRVWTPPEPNQDLTHNVVKGLESALGASPGYPTYKPPMAWPLQPWETAPTKRNRGQQRLSPGTVPRKGVRPDWIPVARPQHCWEIPVWAWSHASGVYFGVLWSPLIPSSACGCFLPSYSLSLSFCALQNSHVATLTPVSQNESVFGTWPLKRWLCWNKAIRVGPNPIWLLPL